jgi:hypothetical protein
VEYRREADIDFDADYMLDNSENLWNGLIGHLLVFNIFSSKEINCYRVFTDMVY